MRPICAPDSGFVLVAIVMMVAVDSRAAWQEPAEPSAPSPEAGETPSGVRTEVFGYDPGGRRDPFVSLLSRGAELRPERARPAGLAGLGINEVALRGIVLSGGAYLAVLEAADRKTYILRGGERLFDGVVASVTDDGVIFLQEVNDPLSLVTEREVRRTLGGLEEGR